VIAFLHGGFRPDHAFSRIELHLRCPVRPRLAARLGMWSAVRRATRIAYASRLHRSSHTRAAIEYYRSHLSARMNYRRRSQSLECAICALLDAEGWWRERPVS